MTKPWGERWGLHWRTPRGRVLEMRRYRSRCRFFDVRTGRQVGPEQANVAPAYAAAMVAGWTLVD